MNAIASLADIEVLESQRYKLVVPARCPPTS